MRINFYEVPLEERLAMADKLGQKLEASLGADGILILDNEVEFLVHLLADFILEHVEYDDEAPHEKA